MRKILTILFSIVLIFGFLLSQDDYIKRIEEKRKEKDRRFATSDLSPLSPVAHFHFDIGTPLTISISEDRVFEGELSEAPHQIKFSWEGSSLFVEVLKGSEITIEGNPVKVRTEVKEGKKIRLSHYALVYTMQTEKLARVMVYDINSPAKRNFKGLKYFQVNPAYRVKAKFIKNPKLEEVKILTYQNVLKTFIRYCLLEFEINGVKCRLTAFKSPNQLDSKELFVPFKDKTSGIETYSAGRFLDVEEEGEECILDFNLAYNPLCSYNPHWNCPLPPKENKLNVGIEAGEKIY
ncbi:MAG: DUF1684 domain-containing protein [Candidatus Aminicenantia bacterium]